MFDRFLVQGFKMLPKKSITLDSKPLSGVWNLSQHQDNKEFGGYEPDNIGTLAVESSHLTLIDPQDLIGLAAIINGNEWRVLKVSTGDYFTTLTFTADDKS
jgi:hypothetical protein